MLSVRARAAKWESRFHMLALISAYVLPSGASAATWAQSSRSAHEPTATRGSLQAPAVWATRRSPASQQRGRPDSRAHDQAGVARSKAYPVTAAKRRPPISTRVNFIDLTDSEEVGDPAERYLEPVMGRMTEGNSRLLTNNIAQYPAGCWLNQRDNPAVPLAISERQNASRV